MKNHSSVLFKLCQIKPYKFSCYCVSFSGKTKPSTNFALLFYEDSYWKNTKFAKSFQKSKKLDVLPQENSVLTSQKNIPLQFICFLNEYVQKKYSLNSKFFSI